MAIPYPSEIFVPYVVEPIGEFLNAWGPPVLFPIVHWMAWVTITLSSVMIIRKVWWEVATGGPENRAQAAIALSHENMERARQEAMQKIKFGENQQRR